VGTDESQGSLIAWGIPPGEGENLASVIDITGNFGLSHPAYSSDEHYKDSAKMAEFFSCSTTHSDPEDDNFLEPVQSVNTICCRGAQYTESTRSGQHILTHLNQGHWGELTYPGCMKVREGTMMHMDNTRCLTKGTPL